MKLVDGVFFGLGNLIRAVVGRIDRVDIVIVGVDFGGIVNKVDYFVAIAVEGICDVVEAGVERIFLVLDFC